MNEGKTRASRAEKGTLLCLIVILALELAGWAFTGRTDAELRARVPEAASGERAWALHVLLNRGENPALERGQVAQLLESDDALLREMATSSDVWRLAGRSLQRKHLRRKAGTGEALRGRYYLKWHGQPVRRAFLREYFRSLEAETGDEE